MGTEFNRQIRIERFGAHDLRRTCAKLQLLQGGKALQSRTCADGLTRFEGLPRSAFKVQPLDLDTGAWDLVRTVPLPAEQAITPGPVTWASPVPELTDTAGELHLVAQGENTDLLAWTHGLFPEAVWQHPRNQQLRQDRESRNVLYAGDKLFLPPLTRGQMAVETGQRYTLRRKGVPSTLRVRLLDDFKPLANVAWLLQAEDALTLQGTTDADGTLQAFVAAATATCVIRFQHGGEDRQIQVNLRNLVPTWEAEGWRQRTRNLERFSVVLSG